MGQKVHPKSLRIGFIEDWESNWFFKDLASYAKYVKQDDVIRKHIKKKLKNAAVSRIKIERKAQKMIIRIITGRSGIVVGRGGQGIDALRTELVQITQNKDIQVDVLEVAKVDADAQLVAESIASQLERRVAYRRAMKTSIQRALRSGVKGIKVMISGRLGGAEIARTEWAKEGRIPLHTFRADIDYGFAEAKTMFGIIGVKIWIFKGEVMPGETAVANVKTRGQGGGGRRQGGEPGSSRGGRRGSGGPGGGRGGRRSGGSGGRQQNAPSSESSSSVSASTTPSAE